MGRALSEVSSMKVISSPSFSIAPLLERTSLGSSPDFFFLAGIFFLLIKLLVV